MTEKESAASRVEKQFSDIETAAVQYDAWMVESFKAKDGEERERCQRKAREWRDLGYRRRLSILDIVRELEDRANKHTALSKAVTDVLTDDLEAKAKESD